MRKKLFLPVLGLMLLLSLCIGQRQVRADGDYGPDIYAQTYCVIDGTTGEVIISQGKDTRMYPASTTKILTALLVLENVQDLDAMLTFTETAVNVDWSSSTLQPKASAGETMSVRDALYGMMLSSANECAAMLGEYVSGSEAAFAELMNQRAAQLGAVSSHFMNAYGIHHDEHYTTAYDLCLILQEAMKNPGFREVMDHVDYTIGKTNVNSARAIRNTHALLNGTVEEQGIIGGKTGSTPQAGRVLTTAVERDGLYTVSALMKSDYPNMYEDARVLIQYAYGLRDGSIPPVNIIPCDEIVTPTDDVRIRRSPSTRGGLAGSLLLGQTIRRTGVYNGWSRVEYDGNICYISNEYLEVTESVIPPVETASQTENSSDSGQEMTEETSLENSDAPSENTENVSSSEDPEGEERGDRFAGVSFFIRRHLWKVLLFVLVVLALVLGWMILVTVNRHRRLKKRSERIRRRNQKYREKLREIDKRMDEIESNEE